VTTDEKLDRLTNVVDALASTVVAHDNQIKALLEVVERESEVLTPPPPEAPTS
jgi:hypothetical protein